MRFAVLCLFLSIFVTAQGQFCQLYDATLGPRITDLRTPTPLTVLYTYTVTGCAVPTTEIYRVTAYPSDRSPFLASPVTLILSGSSRVATATFKFPSLTVTRFAPGEEIYFENFLTNQPNPSALGILTVPANAVTGSVAFSLTSASSSTSSAASQQTPATATSTVVTETSSPESSSTSRNSTPSIAAGIIGGFAAIVVISLLGWVVFKSRYFQESATEVGEKFTKDRLEPNNTSSV